MDHTDTILALIEYFEALECLQIAPSGEGFIQFQGDIGDDLTESEIAEVEAYCDANGIPHQPPHQSPQGETK